MARSKWILDPKVWATLDSEVRVCIHQDGLRFSVLGRPYGHLHDFCAISTTGLNCPYQRDSPKASKYCWRRRFDNYVK